MSAEAHRLLCATIAALGAAILACTDPRSETPDSLSAEVRSIARDSGAATQTDSLHYRLSVRDGRMLGEVMATFRNPTADTAYFIHCNGATPTQLQVALGDSWVTAWTSEQDACFSPPIAVAPGDSVRRRVLLFDGYQQADTTVRIPTDRAVYRLVWVGLVGRSTNAEPLGERLPFEQRVSNAFLVSGAR